MPRKLDFIKGYMGGNEIVLLWGAQIEGSSEVQIALSVLDPPNIGDHQAGVLYQSDDPEGDLGLRWPAYPGGSLFQAGGGLTQVLGKVLADPGPAVKLSPWMNGRKRSYRLLTDAGVVGIRIEL